MSSTTVSAIKAQVLFAPYDLRMITETLSPPAPGEVQVSLKSTTVCGSDVHYYANFANGPYPIKEPISLGHESSGIVVAVGERLEKDGEQKSTPLWEVQNKSDVLKIGDRVALEVGLPCGSCQHCTEGRYNICEDIRIRASARSFPHFQGTFREKLNHPAEWCYRLPDSLSYDDGALLEPLSVSIHAFRRADLKNPAASSVLVIGAGAIGLLCAAVAIAEGCRRIVMVDVVAARLKFAYEGGYASATYLTKVKQGSLEEKVADERQIAAELERLGATSELEGKFDATFECTGVESSVRTCIFAARSGSRIVLVGLGNSVQTVPIQEAACREVDIVGIRGYANTYPKAIEIINKIATGNGVIPDMRKIITHKFGGLENLKEMLELGNVDSDGNLVVKKVLHH